MKTIQLVILFSLMLILNNCIVQFIPETNEDQELLVVEGLITDQPEPNTVKLSKSQPLGIRRVSKPLSGCNVWITDDLGGGYILQEDIAGTYVTDPDNFQGEIGRRYTLHIQTSAIYNNLNYESLPVEMKPVPPIDSIYYEKMIIKENEGGWPEDEVCQVYLNTHDPEDQCKFYRWEYSETWEFRLPYSAITNRNCWLSNNSDRINIKSTSALGEDRISRYPLNYISNQTDRLKVKYSMLVHQYSLTEEEFLYWEKLKNITEEVGGLYDITPSAIPSNISCVEDPGNKVLGYFSVSARSSKRIFIRDNFAGIVNLYSHCISDTVYGRGPIEGLGSNVWILEEVDEIPYYRLITENKGCADCTVRGTNIEPLFWKDDK